jgi:hypothetical protein
VGTGFGRPVAALVAVPVGTGFEVPVGMVSPGINGAGGSHISSPAPANYFLWRRRRFILTYLLFWISSTEAHCVTSGMNSVADYLRLLLADGGCTPSGLATARRLFTLFDPETLVPSETFPPWA